MSKLEKGGESGLNSSPLGGEPNRAAPAFEHNAKPQPRFGGGYYHQKNITHARDMRKELTPWELQLWLRLKGKQLGGYKFRRQQPVGRYIVDFLNVEKKLIVELEGSQHLDSMDDKQRNAYLVREGYRVLRFWNNEVNANIEGVLTAILSVLKDTPHRKSEDFWLNIDFEIASLASLEWLPPKGGATEHASPVAFHLNGEDA